MKKFNVINTCSNEIRVLVNKSKSISLKAGERKSFYEKEGSRIDACLPNQHANGLSFGTVDGTDKIISGL